MQWYVTWVEPRVKQHSPPVKTRVSLTCCWNEQGFVFSKDFWVIHRSTICLILYSCPGITEVERDGKIKIKIKPLKNKILDEDKALKNRIKVHLKSDLLLWHSH